MSVATVALGLTGLGLSATTAQAATDDAADPSAGQSQPAFEDNAEQYMDHAGQLDEGPGEPSASDPGADFDEGLYQTIAGMDNQSFTTLRNAVLSQNPDDEANPELRQRAEELQRSFYSNGCTGVPSAGVTQQDVDACAQHDFRYTVGPNVYGEDTEAGRAEQAAADEQLGENIGGVVGPAANWLTSQFGGQFFKSTPTAG
ncbi:hypothetical protein ABZ471_44770 [Streptomyces sp. NPDC005728]|uniref:hypothetical protein n=1 Tax=Streptomyces sp. NPDC005728 TaxID=3157054 RepID=UPI00340C9BC0